MSSVGWGFRCLVSEPQTSERSRAVDRRRRTRANGLVQRIQAFPETIALRESLDARTITAASAADALGFSVFQLSICDFLKIANPKSSVAAFPHPRFCIDASVVRGHVRTIFEEPACAAPTTLLPSRHFGGIRSLQFAITLPFAQWQLQLLQRRKSHVFVRRGAVMKRTLLASIVSLSIAAPLWAQSSAEGTIRGIIRDEQGGVLPGVTVTATSPSVAGAVTAVSETDGSYRLLNLRPGEYTLIAELTGFSKYSRAGLVVRSGLNIAVDIVMKVGTMSETIQVVGESPM
jgi:carboxypeptidase family protein